MVRNKKKKDQAYEQIRKLILQRRSTERFALSENSLAAELKMSRTPIREALQRLQTEGFIEIHPNRGVVIPEVSVVEVNETFALRMAVEEFVIREVTPLMTPGQIEEMDTYLLRQKEAMERGDVLEYLRHDKDFHDLFFRRNCVSRPPENRKAFPNFTLRLHHQVHEKGKTGFPDYGKMILQKGTDARVLQPDTVQHAARRFPYPYAPVPLPGMEAHRLCTESTNSLQPLRRPERRLVGPHPGGDDHR
jgi:DNA-binding transcriptional regulator YhcF (GntR family)